MSSPRKIPINRINKFQLYGLYCPISNDLMYIGITKNGLGNRLIGHLRSPTNFLIEKWFDELKNI